jgi:plastocyanin
VIKSRSIPSIALALATVFFARSSSAQSLLDRSPNLSGDWVGASGSLFFNFVHRFSTSGAPERKVTNVPTFLVAAGLPAHFLAGFNYSTNSTLAPNFPNEWEAFARWSPISQDLGAPLDLGGQIGYNNAAQGVDGEVSAAKRFGIVRLMGAGRVLTDPVVSGHHRFAVAGGGTIRLGTYLALAGDVGTLTSRDSSERVAWSAGIHAAIPMTPHTLSLQVTNTLVESLQGVSRGTDHLRYGFEFTIPLTLNRYFGRRATQVGDADSSNSLSTPAVAETLATAPAASTTVDSSRQAHTATVLSEAPVATIATPPVSASSTPPVSAPVSAPVRKTSDAKASTSTAAPKSAPKVVRNGMKNINYLRGHLEISVGTTVEWTNADPLAHSVTAVDKSFNSGLIQPGKTFRHTFTKAGTFNYFCMPHPFMKGVIVVKE